MKYKGFGLVAIIIIVAVLIGVGAYLAMHSSNKGNVEKSGEVKVSEIKDRSTIKSLLALNKDLSCTFSFSTTTTQASGTIYISKGLMRGDFITNSKAITNMTSHMIKSEGYMYMWSNLQAGKGMKISESMMAENQSKSQVNSAGVSLDDKVDYSCVDWNPDMSKFTLPSDVTFIDLETMMKGVPNLPSGVKGMPNIPKNLPMQY